MRNARMLLTMLRVRDMPRSVDSYIRVLGACCGHLINQLTITRLRFWAMVMSRRPECWS